ncbi:MAG: DUF2079 domain-containing protein [Myxococcota bacterium]
MKRSRAAKRPSVKLGGRVPGARVTGGGVPGVQSLGAPVDRRAYVLAALLAFFFAGLGWLRFHHLHNQTFDLAFYARIAWGLVRGDGWMPLLDAHVLGLHVSPVLLPIGALGALIGDAEALLLAQGLSAFGAAAILARLGRRRMGPGGEYVGALILLLHPNLSHVLSYEAHPGTLALAPLALAVERLDARDARAVLWACVGMLACREDFAMITAILGLLVLPTHRWRGALIVGFSVLWLGVFTFVLHPRFAPEGGSFDLHLGVWGDTPAKAVVAWFRDPGALLDHLLAPAKLSYLPRVLAPLVFLPLLAPRFLFIALPVLALNLVSAFPTTSQLDSHYLTPALVPLCAAAIVGAGRMKHARAALLGAVVLAFVFAGFQDVAALMPDAQTESGRAAIGAIPDGTSVQAPDRLLPHLAARPRLHRSPPWSGEGYDTGDDFIVFDASHRERYAGREVLLRTTEEPRLRNLLNDPAFGLVGTFGELFVFERGAPSPAPSESARGGVGAPLTECLNLLGAEADGEDVVLHLLARQPCPADLALRLAGPDLRRVDLMADGQLGLSRLQRGQRFRSRHRNVALDGLSVRALRSSGAPPNAGDGWVLVRGDQSN